MRTNNEDTIVEYLRRAQKHLICTHTHTNTAAMSILHVHRTRIPAKETRL